MRQHHAIFIGQRHGDNAVLLGCFLDHRLHITVAPMHAHTDASPGLKGPDHGVGMFQIAADHVPALPLHIAHSKKSHGHHQCNDQSGHEPRPLAFG